MKQLPLLTSLFIAVVSDAASGCGGGGKSNPPPPPQDVDDDLPANPVPGPAPTPPMGWNSWNRFKSNVSDALIRATADAMVSTGMRDAGYQYVNIDDTWSVKDPDMVRVPGEALVADPAKFPNGMAALAEYVHGQKLKLGIYADRGILTCGYYPGSEGHEQQDAATFAGWGIDYVKYDNCPPAPTPTSEMMRAAYTAMGDALASAGAAVGRSIVYSLCAWSFYEWGLAIGSLWRTTRDITPDRASVLANLQSNVAFAAYAGPNGWNDPDMLEVGNFVLFADEETPEIITDYRSHFSLWAISAAPLITGNDLRNMSAAVTEILTNKEVIALDQDPLGYQGVPVRTDGVHSVWTKPLNESGARGVVLFNGSDSAADMSVTWTDIGLRAGSATARDLWTHADLGAFTDSYTATAIPPHDVVVLRVVGTEPVRPTGKTFLSDLPWIYAVNGLGPVEKDQSNGASAPGDGGIIAIRGTTYARGLGVSGPAAIVYRLAKACRTFSATVGIDDQAKGNGSVAFQVWADGEMLAGDSLTGTSAAVPVQVDVTGKRRLKLVVTNGGNGADFDYVSWADAQLDCD
jgi:alpha-galactosidase